MQATHPLLCLHQAMAHALERDLPDVVREVTDWAQVPTKGPRPTMADLPRKMVAYRPAAEEVEVQMFPQTWGSTALGYGGLGGAAITPAYSVVVSTREMACVYFGTGPLAYACDLRGMTEDQRSAWAQDLSKKMLTSRRDAVLRYGAVLPKDKA